MKQIKKQKSSIKVRAGSLKRKRKVISHQSDSSGNKRERERAQINKMRNEKEVTTSTTETQRIISHYYEQLFADKMGIMEEKNKFPGMYNLSRLNQ